LNNLVTFQIVSSPENALKKLSKHNIPVYNLKKRGNFLCFSVNREYVEKVFAIFKHPCYNTGIRNIGCFKRLTGFLKNRFGLAIGAALFICLCALSQQLVLKVEVTGASKALEEKVLTIAQSANIRPFTYLTGESMQSARTGILALDGVDFCSVTKSGSVVVIDVHSHSSSGSSPVSYKPLVAEKSGTLYKLVAVCGTPQKEVGEQVTAGETLIAPFEETASGEQISSLAVGYAEVEVSAELTLFYDEESEKNAASALAAASAYSQRVVSKSYTTAPVQGGVYYKVTFTYIHTSSINIQ